MKTWLIVVIGLAIAALSGASAQQSRDTPVPAAAITGTSTIAGVVVTDEAAPQPVRRATITIKGGALKGERQSATDDQGRFVLRSIPAGRYTVYASKPAWITSFYGSTHPGRPGPANMFVEIGEGQQLTGLTLRMTHGSAITGVVRDDNGRPMQAAVSLLQVRTINGARTTAEIPLLSDSGLDSATTDDQGAYRLYGIPPGEYVISAESFATERAEVHRFSADDLQTALSISRGGSDPHPAVSSNASPDRLADQGDTVTYAPVYFPGALTLTEAVPIKLGANEERSGIDVSLQLVPTAMVSGVVAMPDGTPIAQGRIEMLAHSAIQDNRLSMEFASSVSAGGTFRLGAVPPGAYTLMVMARSGTPPPGGAGRGGGPSGPQLWAAQEVTVDGRNVPDIHLTLQPGLSVTGRVHFAGAAATAGDASQVRLRIEPAGDSFTGVYFAQVDPSGTFTIPNVIPGPYTVTATAPNAAAPGQTAWIAESALAGGRDVFDLPLDIKPGAAPPELAVTFTDRLGEVSGALSDASGKPAPDYQVIVFAADRAFWSNRGRRMPAPVKCDKTGAYRVVDLPAGDYFIAIVADIDPDQLTDPSVFEELAGHAIRVAVARGERKVQNLRIQ